VLLLAASVAIYYIDMCSDLVVCIIFYNKHHYWYMLLTIVAVLLGAGRSYYRTQADTGFFFLEPARLALQAFMLEVSPAGMKTQWDNNDLHVSRMRMQRLSELGQQMWEVTRFEAETQSAVNMLVQFYTVCHESYEPSVVATLLLSATISFLSVLKSLRAFDSRGHVTWQVQTNDGPFPYVFGVGLPSNVSALVSLFRAVEVASRIGTLATAQALLRHGFPQDFGTDLVFPVLLGESVLLLFVASECYPRPRHMWHGRNLLSSPLGCTSVGQNQHGLFSLFLHHPRDGDAYSMGCHAHCTSFARAASSVAARDDSSLDRCLLLAAFRHSSSTYDCLALELRLYRPSQGSCSAIEDRQKG